MQLPALADGRVRISVAANRVDAPRLAFYGIGRDSTADRRNVSYSSMTFGVAATVHPTKLLGVGSGLESLRFDTTLAGAALNPEYRRTRLFAEIDSRTSPGYTRRGGLYRVEWSDYQQTNGDSSFQRTDAEVQHFVPILRENWVIALRADIRRGGSGTATASSSAASIAGPPVRSPTWRSSSMQDRWRRGPRTTRSGASRRRMASG
jgi:hypothetical protein